MSAYVDTPQPAGKVNFGWIGESFRLFATAPVVWIVSIIIAGVVPSAAVLVLYHNHLSDFQRPPVVPFNPYENPGGYFLTQVISYVSSAFFGAGLFGMANKQVRGQTISIGDLFANGKYTGWMLLFQIVFGIAAGLGFVLCFLPLFVVVALFFPAYALLADGVDLGSALSRSVNAIGKDWLQGALFALVFSLLYAASFIACGLGEFVTIPMGIITASLVYRDMIGMPGASSGASENQYHLNPGDGTVWPPRPEN